MNDILTNNVIQFPTERCSYGSSHHDKEATVYHLPVIRKERPEGEKNPAVPEGPLGLTYLPQW